MRIGRVAILVFGLLALTCWECGSRCARAQDELPAEADAPRHRPIYYGLPVPRNGAAGEINVVPNVSLNGQPPAATPAPAPAATKTADVWNPFSESFGQFADLTAPAGTADGVVPASANIPQQPQRVARQLLPPQPTPALPLPDPNSPHAEELSVGGDNPAPAQPVFDQVLCTQCGGAGGGGVALPGAPRGTFYGLGGMQEGTCEQGIGHERVQFAFFELDPTQPSSNLRFQFQSYYRDFHPDRDEFIWAHEGLRGPKLPETGLDYQDMRVAWEVATGKALSVTTIVPIRLVDPDVNPDVAGLSDVTIKTKTVLLDGNDWQITQYFEADLPTGSAMKGLGTGHTSLEPGFLFRLKWTPETYFDGEIKYWFPLGGDPIYDGQVLRYGFGISHLLYENDAFAVIPTLEFVGWTVFNGAQTPIPAGPPQPVDTMGIFNVNPGVRFVRDTGGDLGLFEWGVSGGFGITQNKWYNASFLIECRFVF